MYRDAGYSSDNGQCAAFISVIIISDGGYSGSKECKEAMWRPWLVLAESACGWSKASGDRFCVW